MRAGVLSVLICGSVAARVSDAAPSPAAARPRPDPRVASVTRALEVREDKLREVLVTYEYQAFHLPGWVAFVYAGGGPNPGEEKPKPGLFLESTITWARKNRRLLWDEVNIKGRSTAYPHVRHVCDGEKVLSLYYAPGAGHRPHSLISNRELMIKDFERTAARVGLTYWGKSLPDLLRSNPGVQLAGYQSVGRDQCAVLDIQGGGPEQGRCRLWLDLAHGLLLRRARYEPPGHRGESTEMLADDPRECAPGVYVPTRVTFWAFGHTSPSRPAVAIVKSVARVRRVQVGHLPDSLFSTAAIRPRESVDARTGYYYGMLPHSLSDAGIAAVARRAMVLLNARTLPKQEQSAHMELHPHDLLCGPQSLYILCHWLGVKTTVAELARLAGSTDQGTSMLGLERAARLKGMEATGVMMPTCYLRKLRQPVIAVLPDHFYVIVGMNRSNVITVSPPDRVLVVPYDALKGFWDPRVLMVTARPR